MNEAKRWVAFHVKHPDGTAACGGEAFGYAIGKDDPGFKKFIGAIFYKKGVRPTAMEADKVKEGKLHCQSCGKSIMAEDEVEVGIEIFTVRSLMRLLQNLSKFLLALREEQEAHIRIIEYGNYIGVSYLGWKAKQDVLDRSVESITQSIDNLQNLCARLGVCGGVATNPSEIVLASGMPGAQQGVDPARAEEIAKAVLGRLDPKKCP